MSYKLAGVIWKDDGTMESKDLTSLEALENIKHYDTRVGLHEDDYKIIETALKEKEQQDSVLKTLKEVIEFATILPHIEPNKDNGFDIMSGVSINIQRDIENKERKLLRNWILKTCFPKELKALEIIKEKVIPYSVVNRGMIKRAFDEGWITQEEYNLLKEEKYCYDKIL